MSKLLVLGHGGQGKDIVEIAMLMNRWKEIAFLDDNEDIKQVTGIPVKGKLDEYMALKNEYEYAFVAFGDNKFRLKWIDNLLNAGFKLPTLIHPTSIISPSVKLGLGTVVRAGAVINSKVIIGKGCIISTNSSIGHDSIIHNGVHVSPGVHVAGTVSIGELTWLCIGSVVVNNSKIGKESIVGAGSTVIRDVEDHVLVAGVPAVIKKYL